MIFSFPPFEVDVRAAELRKHGVKIRLPKQPFQVLVMLLRRPGEVVLREEIRSMLWPNGTIVEFDHSINAAIKNIRRVLADSIEAPLFVETVGRQGYRFIGQLKASPLPLLAPSVPANDARNRIPAETAAPDATDPVIALTSDPIRAAPAHFRILKKLGEGSVGEVYLAQDLRLGREVALKFLSLPSDTLSLQMIERFRREALAAAALSHPNACTVYGVEELEQRPVMVMEYVSGETLAARLERGPLPLMQALSVAAQVAAALAEAHRRGIVHRDLKPANIMLSRSGAKVLDFGLAKMDGFLPSEAQAQTLHGTILGTPSYMSPEQAQGKEADARSDIFSLGAVLYEMLTGKRAFNGSSAVVVMAAIVESPPPSIGNIGPLALKRLLQRCLAKDPEERWQSTLDLKAELEWITNSPEDPVLQRPSHTFSRYYWLAVAAVLLAAAVTVLGAAWRNHASAGIPRLKMMLEVPPGPVTIGIPMISPDGSRIAIPTPEGIRVRLTDSVEWQLIAGTAQARNPTWSPDSRSLIYYLPQEAEIKRVELAGGAPRTIVKDLHSWRGVAWNRDGTLLFGSDGSMLKVSENGGTPVPVTSASGYYPELLPDGRHFLYLNWEKRSIEAASLDGPEASTITSGNSQALFAPPNHILFARGTTLVSQLFNPKMLQTMGEAVPVADDVFVDPTKYFANFSVSSNGLIVYRTGSVSRTELTWVDRSGKPADIVDGMHQYFDVAVAPDGHRLAASRIDPKTLRTGIWVIDQVRNTAMRITSESETALDPAWSADGTRIAYSDKMNVYVREADGSGKASLIASVARMPQWSPDGHSLVYVHAGREEDFRGPLLISTAQDHEPLRYLEGALTQPAFSPDGRWLAYVGWEHEHVQVFVESVPAGHGKWQISTDGGSQPIWRSDGRELFYVSAGCKIMAAPIMTENAFSPGTPKELLSAGSCFGRFEYRRQFGVSPDGRRFIVNTHVPDNPPAFLLQNWLADGR